LSDVPEVIPEGVPDRTNKDYHGGCFEAGDAGPDKKLVTDRTSRQIEFVEKVDPAIIGGFVLRVNSMQLDYSVGGELKKSTKQLK